MVLDAEDTERLAIAMARALQMSRSVSDSEHYDHHRWISQQITKEKWRAEFWRRMALHVTKWGAVSVLSALAYAAWLGFKFYMKKELG